jgi:3-dehydroquinate dehydratase
MTAAHVLNRPKLDPVGLREPSIHGAVMLADVLARESFGHRSFSSPIAKGVIAEHRPHGDEGAITTPTHLPGQRTGGMSPRG